MGMRVGDRLLHAERPTESCIPSSCNGNLETSASAAPPPTSKTGLPSTSLKPLSVSTSNNPNLLKRAWRKIKAIVRPNRGSEWEVVTDILIRVGDNEIKRSGVVLFDPQCPEDLISTHFLKDIPGLKYNESIETFAKSITNEAFNSIGTVDIRWYLGRRRFSLTVWPEYNRARHESSTCRVVKSDDFEVMIGLQTIQRLGLYKSNYPLLAAFRSPAPAIDSTNVQKTQLTANIEREKAKREKERRQKEKNEKKKTKDKENEQSEIQEREEGLQEEQKD